MCLVSDFELMVDDSLIFQIVYGDVIEEEKVSWVLAKGLKKSEDFWMFLSTVQLWR